MWYASEMLPPLPPSAKRALFACAAALLASACGSDAPSHPNVLVISVDSLRMDHVSAYGYKPTYAPHERTMPTVDRLAREGALFTNAITTTSWTLPSHMALFTGLNDRLHGVVDNAKSLDPALQTLAEALQANGYRTGGFFTGPNLHPAFGFDHGFDVYEDATDSELPEELFARTTDDLNGLLEVHVQSHSGITSPALTERGLAWLDEAADSGEPFFLFMHYWDPHYNYEAPQEYRDRFDPHYDGPVDAEKFIYAYNIRTPRDVQHVRAMYDAEIRYTDDHIAKLIARLDALGLTDDTIIVFTADHGEEFYEHGKKGHQRNFFSESVRIPLVIRYPHRIDPGTVVTPIVRIQDIMPTVLELTDTGVPAYATGASLLPLMEGAEEGPGPQLLELDLPRRDMHLSGLRDENMLVVWDHVEQKGEYYDLRVDMRELQPVVFDDLTTNDKLPVRMLREALVEQELLARELPRTAGHAELEVLPPELVADLESAGYLGALEEQADGPSPLEAQDDPATGGGSSGDEQP